MELRMPFRFQNSAQLMRAAKGQDASFQSNRQWTDEVRGEGTIELHRVALE
jgi:hypothetical protein